MNTNRELATRPQAPPPVNLDGDQALAPLVRQLARDSSTLVKLEIALAKAEVRQSVGQVTSGAVKLGAAAGIVLIGALVLTAFLVLLLGDLLDNYWLAALIVGLVFTLIGALLAWGGVRRLKMASLAPEAALTAIKEDAAWAQSEIQEVKRDLKARNNARQA